MTSPFTLLYVSQAAADFSPVPGVDEIVATSVPWNRRVGITGTLIHSAGHFAQYLEGPKPQVDLLIERIRSDRRHHSLHVVLTAVRPQRLFPRWSLAYSGDDEFVRTELGRLFAVAQQGHDLGSLPARMIEIMYEMIRLRAELEPTVH